jgi:hypothetical protein
MLRSTVLPGWGQATNHAWIKVAVVVAGEGFLAYQAYDAWQAELDATDNANRMAQAAADAGNNGDDGSAAIYTDRYNQYLADSERYRNTKVNMIWWTAVAHLFQMVDAYVDAHFRNFDAEFRSEASGGPGAGPRVSLALRARF